MKTIVPILLLSCVCLQAQNAAVTLWRYATNAFEWQFSPPTNSPFSVEWNATIVAAPAIMMTKSQLDLCIQTNAAATAAFQARVAAYYSNNPVLVPVAATLSSDTVTNIAAYQASIAATNVVKAAFAGDVSTNKLPFTAITNAPWAINTVVWAVANYVVLPTDQFVLISGNHTTTMPSPSANGVVGKWYWVQCTSAGTNAILRNGSETFNGNFGQGLTKLTNTAIGKAIMLFSNGTNWWYNQF